MFSVFNDGNSLPIGQRKNARPCKLRYNESHKAIKEAGEVVGLDRFDLQHVESCVRQEVLYVFTREESIVLVTGTFSAVSSSVRAQKIILQAGRIVCNQMEAARPAENAAHFAKVKTRRWKMLKHVAFIDE